VVLKIAILGPTGSGKSAIALRLAKEFSGEIVSCDSMQIYRGLDIGTAKLSPEEIGEVQHHLIDEFSIHQAYNADKFKSLAAERVNAIAQRCNAVFLCGGTGLYAKALIYDLDLEPSEKAMFAAVFEEGNTKRGLAGLRVELKNAYGEAAIPFLTNPRRLMRAVEVHRLAGRLPKNIGKLQENNQADDWLQFVLLPPLEAYRQHVCARTRAMLDRGWIDEAVCLAEKGLFETPTARQALGYRLIYDWVHESENRDVEELCNVLTTKTLQYAKRQRTWFRRQHPGAYLLTLAQGCSIDQICDAIKLQIQRSMALGTAS
jgi:tRNA dimethylallyltransferase